MPAAETLAPENIEGEGYFIMQSLCSHSARLRLRMSKPVNIHEVTGLAPLGTRL
jgi:hypothetical protein